MPLVRGGRKSRLGDGGRSRGAAGVAKRSAVLGAQELAKPVQKVPRSKDHGPKRARTKGAVGAKKHGQPVGRATKTHGQRVGRATKPAEYCPGNNEPPLPIELSGDVAKRVWRETEPRLRDRLNLLDIDDRILILYCNCWQLLTECQDVLRREGRYVTMEETGYVARHPAAVDEKNTIAQIRQLAAELGMTPKSGRRVKVRSGDGDALKAFLQQKPNT